MGFLNLISLIGILGLCAIAWLFSENRDPKLFPWRVVIVGLLLQFAVGVLVFLIPETQGIFRAFGGLLNILFEAADTGARFVFGRNLVPLPGQEPFVLTPLIPGANTCTPDSAGQIVPGFCGVQLGYIYAFRALPAVIFFAGVMALFYRLGVIQVLVNLLAKVFYRLMQISGPEVLSGVVNIFAGIESAIVVKNYLAKMTRSQLCTVLSCCFGTAASVALPSYASLLRPVFPNVLVHLVAASIMAIPACFLISKILVPETEFPQAATGVPAEAPDWVETPPIEPNRSPDQPPKQLSPMEAAITGALEGVKIAASILGVLILVLGLVYVLHEALRWLTTLPDPLGAWFSVITLQNILGVLSLPFTVLTGVSLSWEELWQSSVLIGRRLFETAILPYQSLMTAASSVGQPWVSNRGILLLTYALAGFAHLAYWGVVVGGMMALVPSRRRDVIDLSWKALLIGTLATYMTACIAGFFDGLFGTNTLDILGKS